MKAEASFPLLKVIELDRLLYHEEVDPARVDRLMASLRTLGILRNPLVAIEKGGSYILLDGASRSLALRRMGIPCAVVQVVHAFDACVRLETWNHVLLGAPGDHILNELRKIPDLSTRMVPLAHLKRSLACRQSLMGFVLRDGATYGFQSRSGTAPLATRLCRIVGTYREVAEVHRTSEAEPSTLFSQFPHMSALVLFPRIRARDVVHAALNNSKWPMGVTRHLVRGRALGLNVPLEVLASDSSLEDKNDRLQKIIRERLRGGGVRLYQEATYVFDEVG